MNHSVSNLYNEFKIVLPIVKSHVGFHRVKFGIPNIVNKIRETNR